MNGNIRPSLKPLKHKKPKCHMHMHSSDTQNNFLLLGELTHEFVL